MLKSDSLLLGIESSCDDTSCAIVRGGREVLACVVQDQNEIHQKYGGVVPELASRAHLHFLGDTLKSALLQAVVPLDRINGIVVTRGPGLMGCLLSGVLFARGLSTAHRLPIIGVHHILAHVYSVFLGKGDPPAFPFLTLMISGGHTYLLNCQYHDRFSVIGETLDDSPGEVFDKVARVLKLGFPGGPAIARSAANGDPAKVAFPLPLRDRPGFDFSFSGLKTAVINEIRKGKVEIADILASMEFAIARSLLVQTRKAVGSGGSAPFTRLAVVGGVSANLRLRALFMEEFKDLQLFFPDPRYSVDNGAMVASRGFFQGFPARGKGRFEPVSAVLPIES